MNTESYREELFRNMKEHLNDNYDYNRAKLKTKKRLLVEEKTLPLFKKYDQIIKILNGVLGANVVYGLITSLIRRKIPYTNILLILLTYAIKTCSVPYFAQKLYNILKSLKMPDDELDAKLDEFYFKNYYQYEAFEVPDEDEDEIKPGELPTNQLYNYFAEPAEYFDYDLAFMGGNKYGPPTKDQSNYLQNSTYKAPLEIISQNELDQQTAAWGASLPGLLISYGLPGLLTGAGVYGLYKLYNWYNQSKNSDRNEVINSEHDVSWLEEPFRFDLQDSVGTILENEMEKRIEAGVNNEPKHYSTTDKRSIPMMHPTDIETRIKIKKLIKY